MGLDMFALTTTEKPSSEVDFITDQEQDTELHYWRKHPDLHGWMEKLYREKGGAAESFNCVPVVLAAPDLDRLEADIRKSRLPNTQGFFFGESDGSETPRDLTFIGKARAAIQSGLTVYYTSWW
jgi:hypothetical protein